MSCSPWEQDIARYVDDSLDVAETRRVAGHLRSCPECAAFAEALGNDRAILRAEPPEMADVDFVAIRAGIRRGIAERRRPVWIPVLLAAAALVLVLLWRPWDRPAVPVARVAPPAPVNRPEVARTIRPEPRNPPQIARHPARPRRSVSEPRPIAPPPQPDPALEAALQDFLAAEKAPAVPEPSSPVEIRIVSSDASVVLILLQQTSGVSYE